MATDPETRETEERDFGPRGYLPERAAKRARKIILREELGLAWVVASLAAAAVLLGAGGWFVSSRLGPPREPFVETVHISDLPVSAATMVDAAGAPALVVRAPGGLRAFTHPGQDVVYCPASGALEAADGTVWDLDGRRQGGQGESLASLPVTVHAGDVYVDPTAPADALPPQDAGAEPAC